MCAQQGISASELFFLTHALQDSTVLKELGMIPYPVLWGLLVIGLAWQMRVNARSVQVAFTARQLVEQLLLENVEEDSTVHQG